MQEAAEGGSPLAQYNMGLAYASGLGVMQDKENAAAWYTKSGLQNFPPAQYNLGMAYLAGEGVKRSDDEGLKWLRSAAELEDAELRRTLKSPSRGTRRPRIRGTPTRSTTSQPTSNTVSVQRAI